ncbi:MAG: hypothetical protein CTY16_11075 [Methylobacter sp.]|nr:MAG: hypothetical protein CTY16_11075 [Methylobacter sp.]
MSRYYNKIASTIPEFKQVFVAEKIQTIDDRLKGATPAKLKNTLSNIYKVEDLSKFRLLLFCLSKALSIRGIAPRWQDLEDACVTPEQTEALTVDAPVIDLFWLTQAFPKHKAINQRWQALFTDGFNIELAVSIAERQINTARKVKADLNLTRFQQIGCVHFLSKSEYKTDGKPSTLSIIKASKKRYRNAYNREIARIPTMPQVTVQIARQRALIYQCWLLAEQSPTKAATIFKWMTGTTQDKANIARTVKRMDYPVCRKHVE